MNWFFVLGCPRSGTTMLQQALNRHPAVTIPPETAYLTFLTLSRRRQATHLRRIAHDLEIRLPPVTGRVAEGVSARELFEHIARAYLARIGRTDTTHFGEKSPEHLRRYPALRRLFPEAKAVLIYRDGRDVALSLSQVPWMPHDVDLGFALWLHYDRQARRAARAFGPRLHSVRYEDLVRDPARQLAVVCEFLGVRYHPEMASVAGNTDGVPAWELGWKRRALEPITTARVGRWRSELTTDQVARLERWGGEALAARGYDLATDRTLQLPLLFFPKLWAKAARWLLTRQGFGEVSYARPSDVGAEGVVETAT